MKVKSISPVIRERNGRRKRPTTKADIEAAQRAAEERQKATVLAQPHRRGNTDQKCVWPLGQFAILCKARGNWDEALYHAGNEYSALVRRWRLAKGIPDPSAGKARGTGKDTDPDVIVRLEAQWRDAESYVKTMGGMREYAAVRTLCADHQELPDEAHGYAVRGLRLLAKYFGML
ncbi:MAG: hypothetical protein ACK5QX_05595 [bacterium]